LNTEIQLQQLAESHCYAAMEQPELSLATCSVVRGTFQPQPPDGVPTQGHVHHTWEYKLDKNGNMVEEIFPRPDGASEVDYKNTTAYDALERPTSRIIDKRGLTVGDETQKRSGPMR
jgi:hypothetical protein